MNKTTSPQDWNHAWCLTIEGLYDEALRRWDQIVARDCDEGFPNGSRGIARLLVADLDGALSDFRVSHERPGPHRYAVPFIGVALWLRGEQQAACQDWENAIAARRANQMVVGVEVALLLWWASAHSHFQQRRKLAVDELRRRWRIKRVQAEWPGPIAAYLIDKLPEAELLSRASAPVPVRPRRWAQVHFYIGARALAAGDHDRYWAHLTIAAEHGRECVADPEYHLARAELQERG